MTKYYEKKSDGCFFAKCPKDDQNDEVQDGRMWRHWTFGDKEGKTLGYEVTEIAGLIESAYIKEFPDTTFFNIGVQTNRGVEVLQVKLMEKDAQSIAKKLRNIDLNKDVCFGAWLNTKGAFQAHGRTITPCYLTVQQSDGAKGKSVPSAYEYVEGEGYVGLPAGIKTQKMGKDVWDFTERDEALYKEITTFIDRVQNEVGDTRKEAREPTPAEAEKALAGPADNDPDEGLF